MPTMNMKTIENMGKMEKEKMKIIYKTQMIMKVEITKKVEKEKMKITIRQEMMKIMYKDMIKREDKEDRKKK